MNIRPKVPCLSCGKLITAHVKKCMYCGSNKQFKCRVCGKPSYGKTCRECYSKPGKGKMTVKTAWKRKKAKRKEK